MESGNTNDIFDLMAIVSNLTETYDIWKNWTGFLEAVDCEKNSVSKMLMTTHPNYSEKTINCVSLAYLLYVHMHTFGDINKKQDDFVENHIEKVPLD